MPDIEPQTPYIIEGESNPLNVETGLNNLSNTCYANSALQCLFNVPELTHYFLSHTHIRQLRHNSPNKNDERNIAKSYGQLMEEMVKSGKVGKGKGSMDTTPFFKTITQFSNLFDIEDQQDSSEFLNYLLNALHEGLNRVVNKPKTKLQEDKNMPEYKKAHIQWKDEKLREDSIITDLFQGQYMSRLTCTQCNHHSTKFETFKSLSLTVPSMGERRLTFYYVPIDWRYRPTLMSLMVNKQWSIERLYEVIHRAKKTDGPSYMMLCEIEDGRIEYIYALEEKISDIKFDRVMVVYELRHDVTKLLGSDDIGYYLSQVVFKPQDTTDPRSLYLENPGTNIPLIVISHRDQQLPTGVYYIQILRWLQHNSRVSFEDYIKEVAVILSSISYKSDSSLFAPNMKRLSSAIHRKLSSYNPKSLAMVLSCLQLSSKPAASTPPKPHTERQPNLPRFMPKNRSIAPSDLRNHLCSELFVDSDDTVVCLYDLDSLKSILNGLERKNPFHLINYSFFVMPDGGGSEETLQLPQVPDEEWVRPPNNNSNLQKHLNNGTQIPESEIPRVTIQDCFNGFTSKEQVSGWVCDNCKSPQDAVKQLNLWRLPQYLIVHFNRFEYQNLETLTKNDTFIEFPLHDLDLTRFALGNQGMFSSGRKLIYDLYAVCNHYGSVNNGHYTAFAKKRIKTQSSTEGGGHDIAKGIHNIFHPHYTEKWYEFDDDSVLPITTDRVCTSSAYFLLYRLRD
ncbi:Ubiquitin carboxyl-terminal hydrolase 11 [Mycoemilia scoparia]|uniref:ubiquitinyl hydrolase 1 n=1 Tax=Mycoemilia scoparia TaxID=417184 RepID=A0A9W8DXT6_9FUNG|nr:Ubiquitin carboxyl-terminal hydrolase 11 [Mycoemilia scoparia]